MNKQICLLFILSFFLAASHAQEVICAGAGNASGTSGAVSFSVGQLVYDTKTGSGGTVNEGVQQPCEILYFYGIEKNGINLKYTVSPNPAESFIRLEIGEHDPLRFSCQLTDMNGVVLSTRKIEGKITMIPVVSLSPGTYLLSISENQKILTVYKIIKK